MPRPKRTTLIQSSGRRPSLRSLADPVAPAMRAGVLLAIDRSRREGPRPGR